MARITITLEADLAIEVMLLAGAGSPQDAVELIVRDYLARGHRTEARTGEAADGRRVVQDRPTAQEG